MKRASPMNTAQRVLGVVMVIIVPWVATASLLFGVRGQWLGVMGCCLMGGSLAALGLDTLLWREGGRASQDDTSPEIISEEFVSERADRALSEDRLSPTEC